ncbi:hypothetical protein [Moraxella sp. ZY210820]|uniref:hypothetical protein n=1 Tax=unclassified Moraxella TaxID=2685852 RepID=UPI00272F4BB6|nr:hypothetical protein [Moraxella sp. ZY210820]WLF84960.1 hypothetical protein LU301_05715 [Moraxella sp. ZY210820]
MKFTPSHKHTCPNCQQLFKSSELIEKPAKGSEKTIFYVHPDKHCPHCQQKLGQVWDKKFSLKLV